MDAAVIGCGRMGAFTSEGVRKFAPECWFPLAHAEAIEAADGLDLVALCDPSEEGLARAAERCQIAENAGVEGSVVVGKLLESKDAAIGFDAQTETYTDLVKAGYARRILTVPAADNTLRLLPPLNITDDEIAEAVTRLDHAADSLHA